MPTIQALSQTIIHLIAAGEVIDSLVAVVRELGENALDAGATRIAISLLPGQWQVRVADNGRGMGLEDLQQAAAPHSTSKISQPEDLWNIRSLGFRGEALHSLAQLSQLEVCSRPTGAEGWRVVYDAEGQPGQVEAIAMAPGTVVTVSNLFGNWLSRRQSLPSIPQQLRAIQGLIYQLALCHPHVTWQVEHQGRPWLTLFAGETPQQLLPQILRDLRATDLQELQVSFTDGGEASHLYLLAGLPDRCHRHRPDWLKIAMNGRCVRLPELEQVILAGFRRTLPRDRYPIVFLHLTLPPDEIDWNRHPAKAEVYLRRLALWQERVQEAIAQAQYLRDQQTDVPASHRVEHLLKAAEPDGVYQVSRTIQPGDRTAWDRGSLRAVAQVHNRYILVEHPAGLWLVEQHIAHERVLYEQLCDRWQLTELEPPVLLPHLLPTQLEQLQRLQLEVTEFGDQLWAVRTAPILLAQREDCPAALLELSLGGDWESALVATACRSAIRNGTPLTLEEMQQLLDQWQRTRQPRTCPHGRPIYLPLEETALARFFRRHWVIGKSHGI